MSRIIESLRRDHANLERLLDAVERQLAVFDRGERPDYDVLEGALEYCLDYPDLHHHPLEDLVMQHLARCDPAAAAALGDLEAEHRALAGVTRHLADAVQGMLNDQEIPRDAFGQAVRRFLAEYRAHMRGEEEQFFPAAERALGGADWAQIETRMAAREDPLFGARAEERFEILRRDVLDWAEETG